MAGWKNGHKILCKALAEQEVLRGIKHVRPTAEGMGLVFRDQKELEAYFKTMDLSNYNILAVKKQVALTWTVRDQPGQ